MITISNINDLIKLQQNISKITRMYDSLSNIPIPQYAFSYLSNVADNINSQIKIDSNLSNNVCQQFTVQSSAIFNQIIQQQELIKSIGEKFSKQNITSQLSIPKVYANNLINSLNDISFEVESNTNNDYNKVHVTCIQDDIKLIEDSLIKKDSFDWKYWLNISLQIISIVIALSAFFKPDSNFQSETLKILNEINSNLEQQVNQTYNNK